ncbi:9423_t:CDS:2 [Diversispora eburnea]|uniref:9423_t:CDS:1 n=1 Tax=Diversispora eburnea TaxID=1213867 RepID=A0A9N8Z8J7_9GLOM|nr:9423_t:CDS:2 [Diversispora eburnea]
MKTKVSDLSKNKKSRKKLHQKIIVIVPENVRSQPQLKRHRVVTTEEEKEILKYLLQKEKIPSENEINEVLNKLPQGWNIQRVKMYWRNNKNKGNNI